MRFANRNQAWALTHRTLPPDRNAIVSTFAVILLAAG